jgi:hypothetical protein
VAVQAEDNAVVVVAQEAIELPLVHLEAAHLLNHL